MVNGAFIQIREPQNGWLSKKKKRRLLKPAGLVQGRVDLLSPESIALKG
jgi:hypothetical protein